ncbi:hypothetical protein MLD38_031628 [Melastoma candidum]|uniref:Uncharacterized protein n=1 Tax=Melastoma candidum TaxID=119954 RepID=A0ACB9MV00_9MYRT|nr:hypothetical protein MLD38_031628 [Melastoma candidum]
MDSKKRSQTLTLSDTKTKKKKKPTRSEILRKKRAAEGLVSAASSVVDHLSDLDAFRYYDHEGLSVRLDCGRGDRLSAPVKRYIQNLLKVNMEGPFGPEWPTEEKAKRQEMVAPEARYIFVLDDSGQSMSKKSPDVGRCYRHEEDSLNLVGFVHFRFMVEEELPILYVYELQLEARIRGKGLGNFLMELIEVIAKKNHMNAVVLTVQKANHAAMEFYTRKLRYEVSIISPSRVEPSVGKNVSYEILCKAFDLESREVLEENLHLFIMVLFSYPTLPFMLINGQCCGQRGHEKT